MYNTSSKQPKYYEDNPDAENNVDLDRHFFKVHMDAAGIQYVQGKTSTQWSITNKLLEMVLVLLCHQIIDMFLHLILLIKQTTNLFFKSIVQHVKMSVESVLKLS